MNFLGLGPGELLVVMVLALIVFGPQKLPEIGRGLGKAIGEFRRATNEITQEFNRELQLDSILNPTAEQPAPPQSPQAAAPAVESSRSGQAATGEEQPRKESAVEDTATETTSATEGSGEAPAFQRDETATPTPVEEQVDASTIEGPPIAEAEGNGDSKLETSRGEP